MKRLLLVILMLLSLLLCSCSNTQNLEKSTFSIDLTNEIAVKVVDSDINKGIEKIIIEYINNSGKEYTPELVPHLEIKIKGEWYTIPLLEDAYWIEMYYHVPSKMSIKEIYYLKRWFGSLKPGEYRIVKEMSTDEGDKKTISTEFTIH